MSTTNKVILSLDVALALFIIMMAVSSAFGGLGPFSIGISALFAVLPVALYHEARALQRY